MKLIIDFKNKTIKGTCKAKNLNKQMLELKEVFALKGLEDK